METGRARDIEVEIKGPETTEIKVNFGEKIKAEISIPKEDTRRGKNRSKPKKSEPKQAKGKLSKKVVGKEISARTSEKKVANKPKKQSPTHKKVKKTNPSLKEIKLKSSDKPAKTKAKTTKPAKSKKRKIGKLILIVVVVIVLILLVVAGSVFFWWQTGPAEDIKIIFSKETGLYTESQRIELSAEGWMVPQATMIKYTVNGDDPVRSGEIYSAPIELKVTEDVEVYPIRAVYCYVGDKCSKVYSATYILSNDPEEDITLDIISITSDYDNLYDYEKGILVKGKVYDEAVANGADPESMVGNYAMRSEEWIRDAWVMRLTPDGEVAWDQNVGIQVSGGTSSIYDIKSLKLVANEKYGYEKLAYSFGISGTTTEGLVIPKKYNSLRLRSGSQDMQSGNIRSSVASRLAEESRFDGYSATKRAVVYLNGEFYGIFDVEQNFSDSFLKKRFSLANSDGIIKIKGGETEVLAEGGLTGLFEKDLSVAENRKKLEQVVDMDNYLLYSAIEILWNNTDWPGNSVEIWRYDSAEIEGNKYSDGRWRFLIYDTDMIYLRDGNVSFFEGNIGDQFEAIMNGEYKGKDASFVNVIKSNYYRDKFLKIVKELLNGPFETENVVDIIEEEAEKIAPAMRLYYGKDGYEKWDKQIQLMKEAAAEQNERLIEDIYKYFKVVL